MDNVKANFIDESVDTSPEIIIKTKGTIAKEILEDKVRLKISIIGIGNAGSQIISSAHREGYGTFIINSSLKDLSDTVVSEMIPSFIAGEEARGAGKSRIKAKELFKENGKDLFKIKSFINMVEHSDIIFVAASTAGGTGSGIAPELISILNQIYPNKIIIFYGIIPKISDSIISQHNTIQCLDEISKIGIPYMLSDLAYYEDIPNDVAYSDTSKHILQSINVISGKYLYQSSSGMIDENDMRVIVSEPGYMSVYSLNRLTPAMVDSRSIQSYMVDKIKKSAAVSIQRDGIVKQMGVIVNCPNEMMETSKTGNYNELIEYIGTPLAIFENYSVTDDSLGEFMVIMSGMNLPYSRILQCKTKIEEHEEKLKRVKVIDLTEDVDKFSFLDNRGNSNKLTDTTRVVDEKNKTNVLSDFFDK